MRVYHFDFPLNITKCLTVNIPKTSSATTPNAHGNYKKKKMKILNIVDNKAASIFQKM